MTLLTWLLRKMGYVLVHWRHYENLEYAYKMRERYHDEQRSTIAFHQRELEEIKTKHQRQLRDIDTEVLRREEKARKTIDGWRAEVDRLQALVDESVKKYL